MKKAQAWGFDLVAGLVIFSFVLITFYFYAFNYSAGDEETFRKLQLEGKLIGDSLLSEGSPVDWDGTNVVRIGLLSDGKINETKLQRFIDLDYNKTKLLFNVRHDYYVNFSKSLSVGGEDVSGVGGPVDSNADNLVQIKRVSSYDNEPIVLSIYLSD
jgi:hypothetical protein